MAITLQLNDGQSAWLSEKQKAGESRPAAIKRLAGMLDFGKLSKIKKRNLKD